ncbi:MAG: HNH endonuclease [Thermoleophilia bacterium]
MSKNYKGKLCVYCMVAEAAGADHVFAREFFLVPDRGSLPKVPACADCNGAKSELEHYAVAVLPFGGRHSSARENLTTMVPKRLSRNELLHRTLGDNRGRAWIGNSVGLVVPSMTLPVDSERLNRLFELVAKGLLWHHWRAYLTDAGSVEVTMLTKTGEGPFEELFRMRARDRVAVNLGNGTVNYEGAHGVDCPQVSVWRINRRINMFGGVWLADSGVPSGVSSVVGVITGPRGDGRRREP